MSSPWHKTPRPAPADFVRLAGTMKYEEARVFWGAGAATLMRWSRETGVKIGKKIKHVWPDDLAEIAEGKTIPQLAKALKWADETVRRRLEIEHPEIYAKCRVNARKDRPMPPDVPARCGTMTGNALKKHYHCASDTLTIWFKQAGTRPAPARKAFHIGPKPPKPVQEGALSRADLAMRYLQRVGYGACFPLRVRKSGMSGYRYLNRNWTDEELIEEARRRGFEREERRRAA
jgi:hypothetical protein